MSEQPREHEGQDFVAPDESQRIQDPEKAQAMAAGFPTIGNETLTGSNATRTEAAKYRAKAKKAVDLGDENSAGVAQRNAESYDRISDRQERGVEINFDAKQYADSIDVSKLSQTIDAVANEYRQLYNESQELTTMQGDQEKISARQEENKKQQSILATKYIYLRVRQDEVEGKPAIPLPFENLSRELAERVGLS